MIYIVDRIEESFAVCEDENGKMRDIELSALPKIRQGDAIEYKDGAYTKREDITAKRREKITRRFRNMFE